MKKNNNVTIEVKVGNEIVGTQWFGTLTENQLEKLLDEIENMAVDISMGGLTPLS